MRQKPLRFEACACYADDDSVVCRGESVESLWYAVRISLAAMSNPLVGRVEMHSEFAAVRAELRAEIRAGDEETRRHMRVLHEDVISRIALLQESMDRSNRNSGDPTHPRRRRR